MARYTNITLDEMKEVLRADKGWLVKTEPSSKEFIFEFPLSTRNHIVIRVCSSIAMNELARKVGRDAIRVYAYNSETRRGWIKTRRVYRVEGWRGNLQRVVTEVFKAAQERRG